MMIMVIYYFLIYRTANINIKKRKIENKEPDIAVKRAMFTVIGEMDQDIFFQEENDGVIINDVFITSQAPCSSEMLMDQTFEKMIDDKLGSTSKSFLNEFSFEKAHPFKSTESLNIQELDYLPFSNIEPSIKTLYPEIIEQSVNIIYQIHDECIFKDQSQLQITNITTENSISHTANIEVDEETLSAVDSSSENTETDICIESSINTSTPAHKTLKANPNVQFANTQAKNFSGNAKIQNYNSESLHDYSEKIHKKIVQIISFKLTRTSFGWHIDRLETINSMRWHVKKYFLKKDNLFGSFISIIDEHFFKQLDMLNLRSYSELTVYSLDNYDGFNNKLTDSILESKMFNLMAKYFFKHDINVFQLLSVQFLLLFDFFPIFPELMTLSSLFGQGKDQELLFFLRFIHLVLLENKLRYKQIRPVILFLIKKTFSIPKKRNKEINLAFKEKFTYSEYYLVRSVCEKDHSNLAFFMWELDSIKSRAIKYNGKTNDGLVYKLTIFNIEHFRVVLLTFLYQHFIFIEHYNIAYQRYKELIEASFNELNCIFCIFESFLRLIDTDVSRINKSI